MDRRVFHILNPALNLPTVVAIRRTGESVSLTKERGCERRGRRDVGVAIVDFARMVGLIAVAVPKDKQGSLPIRGNNATVRCSAYLSGGVDRANACQGVRDEEKLAGQDEKRCDG